MVDQIGKKIAMIRAAQSVKIHARQTLFISGEGQEREKR